MLIKAIILLTKKLVAQVDKKINPHYLRVFLFKVTIGIIKLKSF